jgi:choline dehydrogenase-like flavoprotein
LSAGLSETQRAALRALCDTYVPSIQAADDPTGFWARSASDVGADRALAGVLQTLPDKLRGGLLGLVDALAAAGIVTASQERREKILTQVASSSPAAAKGLSFYEKQTLLLTYGLPDTPEPDPNLITYGSPQGQNPNWEVLGYPGPILVPRGEHDPRMRTVVPAGGELTLDADVCIVGSGAGGGVIAARMAERGRRVVVLESGGQYTAADFHQLELWGYKHLWYRGGATPTANGTVSMLAGGSLGGGTEINWMNCVRTPDLVRQDWTRNYGLAGVDTADFERLIDRVEKRISSSQRTAYYNAQNLRMREGCERLGYRSQQTHVNWDPSLFHPLMAGFTGFGDQTGGKQTARRTYIRDACENGAQIVVHCRAERILVEAGRAAGVVGTYRDPQGRTARVTVRAPQVVVACGALESPALLLRSGIGGPAVGKYLRLQPGGAVYGVYKDKQKGWWGSPMTANCEQFTDTGGGFGFYMEIPAFGPGFVASVIPWTSGRQHKEVMTKVPYISTFIWFLRDRGYGEVTLDEAGEAVATYQLTDEVDQKNFRQAASEAIRIHDAAGAQEVLVSLAHRQLVWKRGQSLDAFIRKVAGEPLLDGAQPMISAHQLCTCRMGTDPATSVASTDGELHDVKGVWIGDGSACPTSLGANPMITIMALAERTAERMAAVPQQGAAAWQPGNLVRGMAGLMASPAIIFREMAGLMINPFRVFSLGERLPCCGAADGQPAGQPAARPGLPMYSHIIELTAKPGRAREVVDTIRDQAIPQVIRPSAGFVDELVLVSDTDPNKVTAISFWRSPQDAERFYASGFARVSALLQPLLSALPVRRELVVGASTNDRILGW